MVIVKEYEPGYTVFIEIPEEEECKTIVIGDYDNS